MNEHEVHSGFLIKDPLHNVQRNESFAADKQMKLLYIFNFYRFIWVDL